MANELDLKKLKKQKKKTEVFVTLSLGEILV